jgi:3-oxo-5-alpha-steroid 4-dehydrogenase 3
MLLMDWGDYLYVSERYARYLDYFWIMMTLGACCTRIPFLDFGSKHGKFCINASKDQGGWRSVYNQLASFTVSKSKFQHFYVVGTIFGIIALIVKIFLLESFLDISALLMFEFHVIQRLLESYCITEYGSSRIHISGYFCGILHYICAPLSLFIASIDLEVIFMTTGSRSVFYGGVKAAFKLCSVVIFLIASYAQYQCHYILYLYKTGKLESTRPSTLNKENNTGCYALPDKGLFKYVCCPHYSAEICIYLSIWMQVSSSFTCLLLLTWVSTNLSIVASNQFNWYCTNYGSLIVNEKKNWRVMIPGIW